MGCLPFSLPGLPGRLGSRLWTLILVKCKDQRRGKGEHPQEYKITKQSWVKRMELPLSPTASFYRD